MKSYTNLEQSRKLAEILPVESADMFFVYDYFIGDFGGVDFIRPGVLETDDVPCWSLAALLDILPNGTVLTKNDNGRYFIGGLLYDNPLDVCVDMIYKLKEKDLL